jgi:hypothetical protein
MDMLIVEPCAGLGNRLLGLASAYAVAQKLGRELVVIWKREIGCNIKASDLFELPMQVVEISENGLKKEPVAQLLGNQTKKKWRNRAELFLECDDVERIKKEQGYEGVLHTLEQTKTVYLKTFGPICEVNADDYRFLQPSAAILEKGNPLFAMLDAHTVGVHIRRTDHTEAIANSPLSLFVERMQREVETDANATFFVATDDVTVKQELRESIPGERLIFHEKGIIDRDSKNGLEDALIEMLALSKCRKILGSYNSTFSLLPSYIGNIPLEVVSI